MRKIISGLLTLAVIISFSGCAGGNIMQNINAALDKGINTLKNINESPDHGTDSLFTSNDKKVELENQTPEKESVEIKESSSSLINLPKKEIILKSTEKSYIENGALVLKNGKKIYDENGDIKATFTINNKVFYLLKNISTGTVSIKDVLKNNLKTFNGTTSWFTSDDEFVIALKLKGNRSSKYDNIYSFDGTSFKLINKNVRLGGYKTGFFNFKAYYRDNIHNKTILTDIKTNKELKLGHIIVGATKDKLFYIESVSTGFFSSKAILKVMDFQTNKITTILGEGNENIQFYKAGNQIVLKVIESKLSHQESNMHNHYINMKSKFRNTKGRYISLNKMIEINGISKEFSIIPLHTKFSNAGGGITKDTYITYSLNKLDIEQSSLRSYNRGYKPMF